MTGYGEMYPTQTRRVGEFLALLQAATEQTSISLDPSFGGLSDDADGGASLPLKLGVDKNGIYIARVDA